MAEDAANHLTYLASVSADAKEQLAAIRHWEGLKIGLEDRTLWIAGFSAEQIDSNAVKQIPGIQRFSAKAGRLFPLGSSLPSRKEPSVLWTSIERALPVQLPAFNHNFFGVQGSISQALIPAQKEQPATVMICTLKQLKEAIQYTAALRLERLLWAIWGNEEAILFGDPLLSIPGRAFWHSGDFILPAGLEFNLSAFSQVVNQQINPDKQWVIWREDGSYSLLERNKLKPLSRASFRSTLFNLQPSAPAS